MIEKKIWCKRYATISVVIVQWRNSYVSFQLMMMMMMMMMIVNCWVSFFYYFPFKCLFYLCLGSFVYIEQISLVDYNLLLLLHHHHLVWNVIWLKQAKPWTLLLRCGIRWTNWNVLCCYWFYQFTNKCLYIHIASLSNLLRDVSILVVLDDHQCVENRIFPYDNIKNELPNWIFI